MAQETRDVEVRLTRLEALFEGFREETRAFREEVRSRLDRFEAHLDRFEARMDRLETRQDSYFRWVMGTTLLVWGSVIAVVLGTLLTQ